MAQLCELSYRLAGYVVFIKCFLVLDRARLFVRVFSSNPYTFLYTGEYTTSTVTLYVSFKGVRGSIEGQLSRARMTQTLFANLSAKFRCAAWLDFDRLSIVPTPWHFHLLSTQMRGSVCVGPVHGLCCKHTEQNKTQNKKKNNNQENFWSPSWFQQTHWY